MGNKPSRSARGHVAGRDEQLARFYDLEYRDYSQDTHFYIQHALALDPERRLPLLELGCGTGRICVALAAAGFNVAGVDLSRGMLDMCARRAAEAGVSDRLTLACADIRSLSGVPQGPYNLALCALNTFAYLGSTDDQLAALRVARGLLVPHGIIILDLTPPFPEMLTPDDGEVLWQGTYRDEQQRVVRKFVSGWVDYSTQTHHVTIFYDEQAPDGSVSRLAQQIDFRWTGRYEMELLLAEAGYEVTALYGDYDLADFDQASERMIFVARSPKPRVQSPGSKK